MSDSSATQSRSPKKPKPKHRVRAALRTATNRPPRSCAHCLDLIAEYADQETGRNAFMSVGTLMKRLRRGERQTRAMMVRLRAGGWIAEQTAGPDAHAVAAYHKLYPDPRHRPPVHCIVLPTLSCPRGADSAPFTLVIKGCGNGHVRGAETDTEGVRLAADIPSFSTSETSSPRAVTDSIQSLSEKRNPPRRAGGERSIETQIVDAAQQAMGILDLAYDEDYHVKAGDLLLALIEKNDHDTPAETMITSAIRVVKWARAQIDDGSPLQYLRSLPTLWGPRFIEFEASSAEWWEEDGRYEDDNQEDDES